MRKQKQTNQLQLIINNDDNHEIDKNNTKCGQLIESAINVSMWSEHGKWASRISIGNY